MSTVLLAISGSLRKPSFTEKMLDLCIEGMGDNLEVHKFHPHKMSIGPCVSCWSCWGKNRPGECVQKDDFQQILDIYKRADYVLWATPLYFFGFPSTVKNIVDRFFVVFEPAQIESPQGFSEHPRRVDRHPRAVLISSCGFPEIENFDLLKRHFQLICSHIGWEWAGEILISAAGAANAPRLFSSKYELIRKAGAELARGGVSQATMEAIAAPVMAASDYRKMATLSFEGGIVAKTKMIATAIKAMRYGAKTGEKKDRPTTQ